MNAADERTQLVLGFDAVGAADLPLVGGKGANLGELVRAGLPVPAGFCVTTAAFRLFLAGGGADLAEEISGQLDELAAEDVAGVRRVGAAVRERLAALPVPPAVEAAVAGAWSALGEEGAYAVRSSATAEDLPGASFAGQQDTFLNVRGRDALLDAVRRCWISLFTDRAIQYRTRGGFGHRSVALSVVVQELVEPEVSGILFTADPLTGHRHVASVDAGFGLGEALVSGVVSADLYRVDTRTGELVEARVADKALAIRSATDGGTVRQELEDDKRTARALTDEQAIELARLGRRIEAHFGAPQDIEWLIDPAGTIHVVQSRPITALFPLPEPRPADEALHVYISLNHVQVMTDPMPPMARSVLRTLVPFGKASPADESALVSAAGGRLYIDLTPLLFHRAPRRFVPAMLPVADALMADALGQVVTRDEFVDRLALLDGPARRRDLAKLFGPILARVQARLWWRRPEGALAQVATYCDARVAAFADAVDRAAPGAERLRAAQARLAPALGELFAEILPAIAAGIAARMLLVRLTGDEDTVNVLTQGLSGNVTTEMDLEVGDLADLARNHPAVAETLASGDPRAALDDLAAVEGGPAFLDALGVFVDRYGSRGPSEIDITRPRWADDPTPLLQAIVGNLRRAEPGTHRAYHRRQADEGVAAAVRLVAEARRGPLGPVRARVVARLARVARQVLAVREHPKFLLIRVMGRLKAALVEAGDLLVADGRLDVADDIWFLSLDEAVAALDGPTVDLRPLVARRRAEHARHAELRPPRVITSDGEIPQATHDRTGLPPGALAGAPASAGVVTGRARVVLDPSTDVLEPGEILVAPFTDPGWTPLFINAAGLVMEVGGLMTHGSVVAREYGIPAVVGVLDATRLIETGEWLRVNGDRGYVERVEEP